tara:strand:+ start:107 stop:208 length:102 start_codon:yes stop_codon:yes gene_type:complete
MVSGFAQDLLIFWESSQNMLGFSLFTAVFLVLV